GAHEGLVRAAELRRQRCGVGLRVEDRRSAVAHLVARGEVLPGQPVDLAKDAAGGVAVDVAERTLAEHRVTLAGAAEHLEQVELEIAQVALVVAHLVSLPWPCGGRMRSYRRQATRR